MNWSHLRLLAGRPAFGILRTLPSHRGRALLRGSLSVACMLAAFLCAGRLQGAAPIRVTTTVGMISDLVREVGGDAVVVTGLMGPGVDPHLYKATASDVVKLQQAQVVFYVGLQLEGKMEEIFTRMKRSGKAVHALGEGIPGERLLSVSNLPGHHDPHIWFDVPLWASTVDVVVRGLGGVDPARRGVFQTRGKALQARMEKLHQWALAKAAELPAARRVLVTSHDAYNYFGRTYGFQVVGLQGVSTVTEAGLADLARLVDFVKAKGVKAIFVESSVAPQAIERISRDAGVKIGGELFSDAMGTPGQMEHGYDLGTYEGMVRHNLITIVEALK